MRIIKNELNIFGEQLGDDYPQGLSRSKSHRHNSRLRATHDWKHRSHLYHGEVQFDYGDRSMDIRLHIKPRHRPEDIYQGLVGLPSDPQRYESTWTEMEILSNEGKYGFILRLVCRGFCRRNGGNDDLASFVFRIRHEPARIRDSDDALPPDHQLAPLQTRRMTPKDFVALFQLSYTCTVALGGGPISVRHLFHRGQLHTVTPEHSVLPSDPANRQEVHMK